MPTNRVYCGHFTSRDRGAVILEAAYHGELCDREAWTAIPLEGPSTQIQGCTLRHQPMWKLRTFPIVCDHWSHFLDLQIAAEDP